MNRTKIKEKVLDENFIGNHILFIKVNNEETVEKTKNKNITKD